MRLTKIIISGFKSFKDKTVIEIPSNIVAVVGPNGCGKSNIVDAIKWTLGEQNPRYLRAKHMEDVIFSGTENFPPVGMAEVSLFFQKTELPFPEPYASLNELVITRRLYRSGDSEYMINKSPCRLKDIHDLVIDTGLGQRFYGLIEQGMVESFMNYKPEEKRLVFDEVAGTAKYRLRKKATIQKLEAAKLNLERVEDIIAEVKGRQESLEKEAKRAMEYKKIYEELKKIELYFYSQEYKAKKELRDTKKEELGLLEKELSEKEIELQRLEAELEIERNNLFFLEQEDTNLTKAFANIIEDKNRIEKEYHAVKEGKSFRLDKINELKEHLAKVIKRNDELNKEKEELLKVIQDKEKDIKSKEKVLQQKEDEENSIRSEIRSLENEILQLQKELINDKNQSAFINSQISYEEKTYSDALKKLDVLKEEFKNLEEELLSLNSELAEGKNELEQLKSEKNDLESRISKISENLLSYKKACADIRKKINEKALKRERMLGSYNSTKKMLEEYKGLSSGTQHILKNFNKNKVFGTIIENIDVKEHFMTSFENFLKDRIETVFVDSEHTALKAIDYLKKNKLGACNFLPLTFLNANSSESYQKLVGYVSVTEEAKHYITHLFDNVEIVENIEIALERYKKGEKKTYISMNGEVLDEKGIIFGGSRDKHNPYMLEKARLKEIENELNLIEKDINNFQSELEEKEKEIHKLEGDNSELKLELENVNIEISEKTVEIRHKEDELKRKNLKKQQLINEIKSVELICSVYEKKKSELIEKSNILNANINEKENRLNLKGKELEDKRKVLDEVSKALTSFKVAVAEEKRNYQHLTENLHKLNGTISSLKKQIEDTLKEIEAIEELDREAERKLKNWGKELEKIKQKEEEVTAKKRDTELKLEALRTNIREKEQNASRIRVEVEKGRKTLINLKDKLTELNLRLEGYVERIREKYFVDLSNSYNEYLSMDVEKEKCNNNFMEELRKKIAEMGEVNLLSIDEYEEVNRRYEFLCKQKRDLGASIESLNKAIERINNASLELFSEALKNIESNFDKLFKRLFGGGKARIILTEEDNPLESGVDIVVEPPHKKFQNINLLSGGEKALVTLALIFAFYMQKPSPFCILDEVDAPLDDANVFKFRELLNEMSKKTQFLIVTHNKSVMESAGILIGVTMENPGVSKLVAVKTQKEFL
jgi:chromosome segregation protein